MRPEVSRRSIPEGLREAYTEARETGWSITRTGSGHLKWQPPSGPPVFGSYTPGGGKAVSNIIGKLRRAGLNLR